MKTVVVTGATSGIGRATALDLATHGFHVIGTARSMAKAERLVSAAAERGHSLRTVLLDITNPDSCRDAVAEIADLTGGSAWAWVNNAGVAAAGAFEDLDEADARAVLEANLLGTARMTRLVLPGMRQRGEGRIIQMSSIAGVFPLPYLGWYCAAKHGLEALTDALRVEITGSGIHLSLIEPGFINTPMVTDALARLPAHSRYAKGYERSQRIITGRRPQQPEAVARTVRRALTARRPHHRYRTGWEASLTRLLRLAPSSAADAVMRTLLRP
ncbi:SDR family oxidoreductase [Streptomyces sp. NPDC090442]|uniref:SDR family oxidoreductase n=1 Tax=Streptomyces sp. NPDC090442 TaxID=3365962 RepID=UPI0038165705